MALGGWISLVTPELSRRPREERVNGRVRLISALGGKVLQI